MSGVGIQPSEANNMYREIDKHKFNAMLHSSNIETARNNADEDASVNQEALVGTWNFQK